MTALRPEVTRAGVDQPTPSADRETTTSLAAQPARKRQSCQTASTCPFASTSAATSGGARNGLASRACKVEIVTGAPSVTPPSVDLTATMPVRGDQKTMTSVPSGRGTGD